MEENITTWGGVLAGAVFLLVRDTMVRRKQQPAEDSKVQNLNAQTDYMRQIAETLEQSRKSSKKDAKKIRRKLDGIHQDVLTVKNQTKKENKP